MYSTFSGDHAYLREKGLCHKKGKKTSRLSPVRDAGIYQKIKNGTMHFIALTCAQTCRVRKNKKRYHVVPLPLERMIKT